MRSILLLLIAVIVASPVIAQQDTIANPGFERWAFNPSYDDPEDWNTLNPLAAILGSQLAFRATAAGEFQSGTSALKLVTTNISGIGVTPSICTNGSINTVAQTIEGGVPIDSRPTSFGGWYRYNPVNTDSANVSITLTRWNTTTNSRDEIGRTATNLGTTNGQFESFELVINYSLTEVPDTALIFLGSGTDVSPQEGSTLYVDGLYYSYPQGIESPESLGLTLFPNPVTDVVQINTSTNFYPISANVYSTNGQLLKSLDVVANSVNVASLKTGTFVLELMDEKGIIVRSTLLKN